jgi:predicted nucleotidyltransferase
MPVRSLRSSVLKWPERETVLAAARLWASEQPLRHPQLLAVGCYGSYARGDWGVGSDLDVVAIMQSCDQPFERRALSWDLGALPVPAELLVYTRDEWERILREGRRFGRVLQNETVWLWVRNGAEAFS